MKLQKDTPYLAFVSKNAKYKIGPFSFKTKQDITHFVRSYLDSQEQEVIITDEKIIDFVRKLIKIHPTRGDEKFNNIMVKEHQEEDYFPTYNNFFIELEDGTWNNISTVQCIKAMKVGKTSVYVDTDDLYDDNILDFGKYKGYSLEKVFQKDPKYFDWLLENVSLNDDRRKEYHKRMLDIKTNGVNIEYDNIFNNNNNNNCR